MNHENDFILKHQDVLLQGVGKDLDTENAFAACIKAIDELRQGSADLEPFVNSKQIDPNVCFEVDIGLNTLIRITGRDVITVWNRYEKLLKQYNTIDYTGLIIEAINVLNHPLGESRKRVQDGLKAIIVDEYQDTSRAQEKLLFDLAGSTIPINVVGDTDQTIYSFNGSSISNMQNFPLLAYKTNIPVLPSINMVENYRSTSNILETANRIRKSLTEEKQLVPAKDIFDITLNSYRNLNIPVRLIHAPRLELAADFIAREIFNLVNIEGINESEIAVLVRKNSEFSPQGDSVKKALSSLGVISETILSQSNQSQIEHLRFVYEFCQDPENYGKEISDVINCNINLTFPKDMTTPIFISYLQEAQDAGATYCYEAVDLLFDDMNLEDNQDILPKGIQIRTVHSAKGEEFRVVFLLYLGDRSFPHGSRPEIDEERRLLYVGITRAQERLYILGRPGIHQDDFFNDCNGPSTLFEENLVFGGKGNTTPSIDIDMNIVNLIEQARATQIKNEEKERKKLWKMFEEDF
jgi:DNA helicase-2/ATP-dependent DNA helicase PcrA